MIPFHQKLHEPLMMKTKICKRMPCAVQQPPLCDGWVNGSFCNQWKKLQRERSAQLRTATTKTSTNGVAQSQNTILEYQSQENCRPDPSREGTSGPFPARNSPVSFSAWEFPGRLQTSSPRWRGAPPKPCKAGRGADMQPDSPDQTRFGHDAVFLQRRLQLLLNFGRSLESSNATDNVCNISSAGQCSLKVSNLNNAFLIT